MPPCAASDSNARFNSARFKTVPDSRMPSDPLARQRRSTCQNQPPRRPATPPLASGPLRLPRCRWQRSASIGVVVPGASSSVPVTGISLNSRSVRPGDLYVALPGARGTAPTSRVPGCRVRRRSRPDGRCRCTHAGARPATSPSPSWSPASRATWWAAVHTHLPVPARRRRNAALFGVTGTNGKTTTTYFINALLQALGKRTGLIGTIEIPS